MVQRAHKIKKQTGSLADTQDKKVNKGLYFLFGFAALFLAWIINKDIGIPSWLTITASVIIAYFLLFSGLRRPELPFYVLVAYIPFNKMLSGTFGGFMTALNLTNILILICIFCWAFNSIGSRRRLFEPNALNWVIFLFCLFGIFSVIRGGFYYGSKYIMEFIFPLKRWLTPIFLYFIALNLIKSREVLKNTVIIIMIVLAVVGLMTVKEGIDLGDAGSLDSSRVEGIAGQPNMMAAFLVYYMFLFFGFFLLNWRKIKSWGLLIPFLVCFRGMQVTYSRGAYLAFAFATLAITFLKNKLLFVLICFGMLAVYAVPQYLPGGLRYAVERTSKGDQIYGGGSLESRLDLSSAKRLEIWKGAVEMIKDNPAWGVGYGVFPYAIPMYTSGLGEIDAHNTYLIIAAEMGIPVLIIFLLIILIIYRNTFWLFTRVQDPFIKAVALGMLGGLAGMLMANMFGSRLESEEVSAYFWILAGLIIRAVIMKKRKEIE